MYTPSDYFYSNVLEQQKVEDNCMEYHEYPNDPDFSHGIEWEDEYGQWSVQAARDGSGYMLFDAEVEQGYIFPAECAANLILALDLMTGETASSEELWEAQVSG